MTLQMYPVVAELMDAELEERIHDLVSPILARSRGRVTWEMLRDDHRNQEIQIWAILDDDEPAGVRSIGITRIIVYPTGERVMRLDHGAGKIDDAIAIMPVVERMAREKNCHRMRIDGRVGWQRVFPGWVEVSRIIEKDL